MTPSIGMRKKSMNREAEMAIDGQWARLRDSFSVFMEWAEKYSPFQPRDARGRFVKAGTAGAISSLSAATKATTEQKAKRIAELDKIFPPRPSRKPAATGEKKTAATKTKTAAPKTKNARKVTPKVADTKPTEEHLLSWYAEDKKKMGGVSSVDLPRTFRRYEAWAKENGGTPDMEQFKSTIKAMADAGKVELIPHSIPREMSEEQHKIAITGSLGEKYLWWLPRKR